MVATRNSNIKTKAGVPWCSGSANCIINWTRFRNPDNNFVQRNLRGTRNEEDFLSLPANELVFEATLRMIGFFEARTILATSRQPLTTSGQ